jgi:hypothetical protein
LPKAVFVESLQGLETDRPKNHLFHGDVKLPVTLKDMKVKESEA